MDDEPVCCDVSWRRASRSNGFELPNMGNAGKSHLPGSQFLPRVGNQEFRPPSPPTQLGWLGFRPGNDAGGCFRGAAVVGAIEGDRADGVTAKAPLGLFFEPFSCPLVRV